MSFFRGAALAALMFLTQGCASLYKPQPTMKDIAGFKDTEKPNALLILPKTDHNAMVRANYNPSLNNLYKKLKKHYDLCAVTAEDENDLKTAVMSMPCIDCLVLAGHGTQWTLQLGGREDLKWDNGNEIYFVDVTDTEMADYLPKKLNKGAKILLFSCNGGKGKDNLADKVCELSGADVTACTDNKSVLGVYGKKHPLTFRFETVSSRSDSTYTAGALLR